MIESYCVGTKLTLKNNAALKRHNEFEQRWYKDHPDSDRKIITPGNTAMIIEITHVFPDGDAHFKMVELETGTIFQMLLSQLNKEEDD